MPRLYSVFLGGRAEKCNTELHDTVFVVGETLEDTYPLLVNKWFGIHQQLHIDASIELKYVDGYEVVLAAEKSKQHGLSLYFVNFGAYKAGYFGEVHESAFYVASSKTEAVAKAKKELCLSLKLIHCDDNKLIEDALVDDVVMLEQVDKYFINLVPFEQAKENKIHYHYQKLDLPDILEAAGRVTA